MEVISEAIGTANNSMGCPSLVDTKACTSRDYAHVFGDPENPALIGSDDGDLGSAIVDRNAEETPKTVRNLTERSLDHENRVLEYSSNLKDLANEIALSSPPFTPSLANQMHLRQSGSVFSTVSEQQTESVEERPQHLGSLETLATVEDGCTSEQRTFCPTAEELNFFRSGPLKFTVR